MSKRGWHILREGEGLVLCRRLPPRFDLSAETWLPGGAPLRLAHQIRQDMWRALRRVRGFAPVVRLVPQKGGWRVEAGGSVAGPVSARHALRLQEVLDDPVRRARWLRCAGYPGAAVA